LDSALISNRPIVISMGATAGEDVLAGGGVDIRSIRERAWTPRGSVHFGAVDIGRGAFSV